MSIAEHENINHQFVLPQFTTGVQEHSEMAIFHVNIMN